MIYALTTTDANRQVEDDENTRELLRRTLAKDGWQVSEAEHGRQGRERLADQIPSVILLDLMMPEMDGFEFLQERHRQPDWRRVPVIVIAAKTLTEQDRQRLNGQVAQVLPKGSTPYEDLLAEVRALLAQTSG